MELPLIEDAPGDGMTAHQRAAQQLEQAKEEALQVPAAPDVQHHPA